VAKKTRRASRKQHRAKPTAFSAPRVKRQANEQLSPAGVDNSGGGGGLIDMVLRIF